MKRAALLALLLLAGCKKKAPEPSIAEAFRDAVCRCSDRACVQKVVQTFPKLAMDDDAANVQVMDEAIKCYTNIAAIDPGGPGSTVPAMPPRYEADALIASARTWQRASLPGAAIWEITAAYVEANGALDGEFGRFVLQYGASSTPVDDPKRKTGAPVKPPAAKPTTCATLNVDNKRWINSETPCVDARDYVVRCSVVAIWQKAIAKGAPADALATVRFVNTEPPTWSFTIIDEPRNVNIAYDLPDDCPLAVEAP